MREALFRLYILTIGLTLLGTLVYGLSAFPPQTITQTMIDSAPFRITLSVCVILQVIIWVLCIWAKRESDPDTASWAFVALSLIVISWIALSTILTDSVHMIFVAICYGTLIIFILLITRMTTHYDAGIVLRISIISLIACVVAMIILYNNHHFFIPEYIGFISYAMVFTFYFVIHTDVRWAEGDLDTEYALRDIDFDDPCQPILPRAEGASDTVPLDYPANQRGSFYVGRMGAVWVHAAV
jgi:hypothetical protein